MTPQLVAIAICLIGAGIGLGYTLFYLVYHYPRTRIERFPDHMQTRSHE